jgi:hypothetical protein
MQLVYPYDPSLHRAVELPVTHFLRRELERPDLITWHFTDVTEPVPGKTVEKEVWVVSLCDGKQVLDIGHLETGLDGQPQCSRELAQELIHRMSDVITRAEAKQRLLTWQRGEARKLNDMAARHLEGHKQLYAQIKKEHGEMKADEYAHSHAPELIDGSEWSLKGAVA